jgi:hypothetical protein
VSEYPTHPSTIVEQILQNEWHNDRRVYHYAKRMHEEKLAMDRYKARQAAKAEIAKMVEKP